MLVLGIESSCDETGLALYDTERGLLSATLHSQVEMHGAYGGVVPELASRDHIRRILPLLEQAIKQADASLKANSPNLSSKQDVDNGAIQTFPNLIDAIAFTQGPGLAGALLVGASIANSLGFAWNKPVLGIHHLEGHLLSPLLSENPPEFPFIALLVSGGHTQLMLADQVGSYQMLGETLDDAAGEAFDKTAKLLDLGYPGGPALSELATLGQAGAVALPRPMLHSNTLDFSFSGLKTAVLTYLHKHNFSLNAQAKADLARGFVDAVSEVLVTKALLALKKTGLKRLVVAGGVGANQQLRQALQVAAQKHGFNVHYPEPALCTDNGAMIALAGALRLQRWPEQAVKEYSFSVRPRWDLSAINPTC